MAEAFVYCWTDHLKKMLYIGVHKGHENDGYISSSHDFNYEYYIRPQDFTRQIIATGSTVEMHVFESTLLKSVDAAKNCDFYNKNNNDGKFVCLGHTEKTRTKMSKTWKSKKKWNCDNKKAISVWQGQKHTKESRLKMVNSQKKHSLERSKRMTKDNPMKDPALIQKMLETRKKNKMEKLNVNSY